MFHSNPDKLTGVGHLSGGLALNQFQQHKLGCITLPQTEFQDAGITARAVGIARGDIIKQFADDIGIRHTGCRETARIDFVDVSAVATVAGQCNQPFRIATDGMGLCVCGLNTLVLEQLIDQSPAQRISFTLITT
jgi:hypothetical protein